jgi:hypothetical protein
VGVKSAEQAQNLPREIDGVPVVAEVQDIDLLSSSSGISFGIEEVKSSTQAAQTSRRRPVPHGASMNHEDSTACTGAFRMQDTSIGEEVVLGNNHCWALKNDAEPGDRILQPSALDGGTPANDTAAVLENYVPIVTENQGINQVDVAWARPRAEMSDGIIGLDKPVKPPAVAPEVGDPVFKSGRTSGVTKTVVESADARISLRISGIGETVFSDLIQAPLASEGGDSGAPVVASRNDAFRPVGLLFAGAVAAPDTWVIKIQNIIRQTPLQFGSSGGGGGGGLSIVDCSIQADFISVGDEFTVTAEVKNGSDSSETVEVRALIDGESTASSVELTVDAGETAQVDAPVVAPERWTENSEVVVELLSQ